MNNEEEIEGNNKLDEEDLEIENNEKMTSPPRKFYRNRLQAEKNRRKGDRIYHKPGKGFYIRRPQEKSLLEKLLGW